MGKLILLGQRAKELLLKIDLAEGTRITVKTTFSLEVNFSDEDKMCYAQLACDNVWEEHPELFHISATIIGEFQCEDVVSIDDKKKAHVEAYYQLFPFMQAQIMRLTTDAGVPPLIIRRDDMDPEGVELQEEEGSK